ncbi:hypothetical protein H5410_021781 [Solanum commersonii]|uniref:Uncharacterized protein n=1 Tax=Solanum commersonii TaxID=4109 RepID=A0A9J5ZG96_SOLCO|nr:hypothetical protein H5410_021781 [Solanum commersonii]
MYVYMESIFVRGRLDTFVELELAQVASIASMRIFGDDHRVKLRESLKRHEPPFVPVCEALKEVDQKVRKGAVGGSPSVSRSSTISPNDPECEDAKGKTLKAMS